MVIQFIIGTNSLKALYDIDGSQIYSLEISPSDIFNNPTAGTLILLNFNDVSAKRSYSKGIGNSELGNYSSSIKMWRLKK